MQQPVELPYIANNIGIPRIALMAWQDNHISKQRSFEPCNKKKNIETNHLIDFSPSLTEINESMMLVPPLYLKRITDEFHAENFK